jgi:flavin-dependent dehydrogenase
MVKSHEVIHDIIIVGSGPAGISTALHLVKFCPELAERIMVLEAERHPRPKLCAGGILNDGVHILKNLGLDPSKVPHIKVNEAYFRFEGRGFCVKLEPQSFMVVRREEFDAWLAQAARGRGIRVEEGARVIQIEPGIDGITIRTENNSYFTRIVVGADGARSIVRRAITNQAVPTQSLALEFLMNPSEYKKLPIHSSNQAFFDFSIIPEYVQGYIWQFPTPGDFDPAGTRGIYHARLYPSRFAPPLKEVLQRHLLDEQLNLSDYELKGHPIWFFHPQNTFSAPRILLVGDAAGVDPIYGEGISFALGYGALAALEIKDAFNQQNFSFSHYKQRILNHPMGWCLKRRFRVARLLYRSHYPAIQRLVWWRLGTLLKWYIETRLINWARKEG